MEHVIFQCGNCLRIFSPGVVLAPGADVTFVNCTAECPFCACEQTIPDATFRATVEGIARVVFEAEDPLAEARRILIALKEAEARQSLDELRRQPWYDKLRKWLPNSPKKLAYYAAIVTVISNLLTAEPKRQVECNEVFIRQFNQVIVVPRGTPTPATPTLEKVGRNKPCPCGSGKKFKHCCGK